MRFTKKTRYGVTAMLDLAIHYDKGLVTLSDIAERQPVSRSYLEDLFALLRKEGLVQGVHGPRGGYRLTRTARDITVVEIINAVEETSGRPVGRLTRDEDAATPGDIWRELAGMIHDFLATITLAALIEEHALASPGSGNNEIAAGVSSPENRN